MILLRISSGHALILSLHDLHKRSVLLAGLSLYSPCMGLSGPVWQPLRITFTTTFGCGKFGPF